MQRHVHCWEGPLKRCSNKRSLDPSPHGCNQPNHHCSHRPGPLGQSCRGYEREGQAEYLQDRCPLCCNRKALLPTVIIGRQDARGFDRRYLCFDTAVLLQVPQTLRPWTCSASRKVRKFGSKVFLFGSESGSHAIFRKQIAPLFSRTAFLRQSIDSLLPFVGVSHSYRKPWSINILTGLQKMTKGFQS